MPIVNIDLEWMNRLLGRNVPAEVGLVGDIKAVMRFAKSCGGFSKN